MKDYHEVKRIDHYTSKITGADAYRITLQNLHTCEWVHTQVDSSYGNYEGWRDIVEAHPQAQILSGCRIVLRNDQRLVNADSKPVQEIVCDRATMEEVLTEWRKNR